MAGEQGGTTCATGIAEPWRHDRGDLHAIEQMGGDGGRQLLISSYTHPAYAESMAETFALTRTNALLSRGLEGESVADPRRTAQVDGFVQGRRIEPPRCTHCAGPVRPGVVWFGERLPEQTLARAFDAAQQCDVLLSVGTSGVVQPAASMPRLALAAGATVVQVNPQPASEQHPRAFALAGKAGEVLPELMRQAFP